MAVALRESIREYKIKCNVQKQTTIQIRRLSQYSYSSKYLGRECRREAFHQPLILAQKVLNHQNIKPHNVLLLLVQIVVQHFEHIYKCLSDLSRTPTLRRDLFQGDQACKRTKTQLCDHMSDFHRSGCCNLIGV